MIHLYKIKNYDFFLLTSGFPYYLLVATRPYGPGFSLVGNDIDFYLLINFRISSKENTLSGYQPARAAKSKIINKYPIRICV